jgi:hypothetical protein
VIKHAPDLDPIEDAETEAVEFTEFDLLEIEELRADPTVTADMVAFVLACKQAELELRNGTFVPARSMPEFDARYWDELSPEAHQAAI